MQLTPNYIVLLNNGRGRYLYFQLRNGEMESEKLRKTHKLKIASPSQEGWGVQQ